MTLRPSPLSSAAAEQPAGSAAPQKAATAPLNLMSPKEAAKLLKVSTSWVAKARMTGEGPAYIRIGRAIRYSEVTLLQWLKSRQRLSTSEQ